MAKIENTKKSSKKETVAEQAAVVGKDVEHEYTPEETYPKSLAKLQDETDDGYTPDAGKEIIGTEGQTTQETLGQGTQETDLDFDESVESVDEAVVEGTKTAEVVQSEPQVKELSAARVKELANDKYIPVVDSFGAGNVVGFVTVPNVGKFVGATRGAATRGAVLNIGNFGAVACDYKDRVIGVLGCVAILGKQVPAIDCVTTSQQTNMGCFEDFRTVTEELSGHKYTRMMEFSDFEA